MSRGGRLIVLARAPVPGQAKTRLAPAIGPERAARLHARMVRATLECAVDARIADVELCCAPDASHAFFRACADELGVALADQAPGDLGARMRAALERALAAHDWALLIGTDCPVLEAAHLREAARLLAGRDSAILAPAAEAGASCDAAEAVFAPAEDGGYVLVGLRRPVPRLFSDMPWGTAVVMEETRRRLREAGLTWRELPTLWDVDRPDDLDRLRRAGPGWVATVLDS